MNRSDPAPFAPGARVITPEAPAPVPSAEGFTPWREIDPATIPRILIAEDASIFDFVRQTDTHPTNLVVKGTRIAGLVSLSDLQQLPVRAALFTLVTSFEIAMAELIAHRYPKDSDWKALLSEGRREKLASQGEEAKRKDSFANELLFTQFCDKRDIVLSIGLNRIDPGTLRERIKAIERLRNNLAHANAYADSVAKGG